MREGDSTSFPKFELPPPLARELGMPISKGGIDNRISVGLAASLTAFGKRDKNNNGGVLR